MPFSDNYGAQVAGRRTPRSLSITKRRRVAGADRISPVHNAKARRSSVRDSWIFNASAPSNKNTSGWKAGEARKKETPPQRECDKCHAICDGCRVIPFLFIIFNSTHTGTPFMHRYESGIPSETRFSIRCECVFFGRCFFSDSQRFFSVFDDRGIGYIPLNECVWVRLSQFSKAGNNVLLTHVVKLMNVCGFSSVNGQPAQSRADFLSVDSGRKLPCFFGPSGQFIKTFKLMHQGHAVFSFRRLFKFFNQFDNVRKISAVEKFGRHSDGRLLRIPSHPRTLSVAVSTLDIIFGKSLLTFRQSGRSANFTSSVFCGFFIFRFQNQLPCGLKGVTTCHKCNSCNRCCVRVCYAVTSVTPNFKNFFKKIKGGKNIIGMCILLLTIPCYLIRLDKRSSQYIGGQVI